jgi:putative alpha-1,2-mannosidase
LLDPEVVPDMIQSYVTWYEQAGWMSKCSWHATGDSRVMTGNFEFCTIADAWVKGMRGFDVATIGGLLVTVGQSTQALQTIVTTVRAWLGRGGSAHRSVRVEIGGDVLELADASTEDQEKLVDLFLRKHG